MRKNLRRFLSATLLMVVLMGLAAPAWADYEDYEGTPMAFYFERNLVESRTDLLPNLGMKHIFYVKSGSEVGIGKVPEFSGEIQTLWLTVVDTPYRISYFEKDRDGAFPTEITVHFTNGQTVDGKTVDLSDPRQVYVITMGAETSDGRYIEYSDCFRAVNEVNGDYVINDGTPLHHGNEVVIPDGVTSIGNGEFSGRADIVSVTLPNSVVSIGSMAFSMCDNLKEINIPNGVTEIGEWAFEGCSSLQQITIGDHITKIGRGSFSGCSSLIEFTIPDSITEIGTGAFADCSSLVSITIPDSVTEIEGGAFSGCSNLQQVTFGQNVAFIGDGAFRGCKNLSTLTLPNSVAYVGHGAFASCSSLEEVSIPQTTVLAGGDSVFADCERLGISAAPPSWRTNAANGEIVGYSTYTQDKEYGFVLFFLHEDGTLVSVEEKIPFSAWNAPMWDEIAKKDTTPQMAYGGDLGEYGKKTYAWLLENSSTELVLPEGVKTIIDIWNCYELERLVLPSSLQVLGDGKLSPTGVFDGCTSLKELVFPAPEEISPALYYQDISSFFTHCPSLKQIVNCPDRAINERLTENQRIDADLRKNDPQIYLAPQSERIVALSNQICAGYTTEYEKAKAVFNWITENIAYDYDYYRHKKSDVTILPEEVLDSKLTVCDGYSRLTQALLLAQNIPAVYISGTAKNGDIRDGSEWIGHAWNAAYVDGHWIYIDSTWGRPGTTDGGYVYDSSWFDPSILTLSMRHNGTQIHTPYNSEPSYPSSVIAAPIRSTVLVNGQSVAFDAYGINGNNYFKLRDLAKVLSGTGKQFEVTWDGKNNAIGLLSGQPYTVAGGELAQGDGTDKTAQVSTAAIHLDGQPVSLLAYNIGGNNYFKLRDVGQAFDFNVSWDGARNTIIIDTTQSYTSD